MRYALPMMKKRFAAVVLAVAACSSYSPEQMEGNIVRPGNFFKGSGVITGVGVLPRANNGKPQYRLSLMMDQGGFQQVDTDNDTFFEGQAVDLTNDGRIVHVSGTGLRAVR